MRGAWSVSLLSFLLGALACASGGDGEQPSLEALVETEAVADVCPKLQRGEVPVIPVEGTLRVAAFGDFGKAGEFENQKKVAKALGTVHQENPFLLGLTVGDNFYEKGLNDKKHSRWETQWENLYSPLGIRFYATLGNHDYYDPGSPKAEMERSDLSKTWCLPKPYYTYIAGPVQLFAVDTDPIERQQQAEVKKQLAWLEGALAASNASWKIVYGHHPIYTNGDHGKSAGVLPRIKAALLPLLTKHKVNVYLAGHEHDMQSLKPEGGVFFLVSGGGGQTTRPLKSSACRDWAKDTHGFTMFEADEQTLTARFFDDQGKELHQVTQKKGDVTIDCVRP